MGRLTFDGNFCDIAQCRELPCPYNGACSQRKVWEQLKAYEDTGLSPKGLEHAAEIENGLNSDGYSIARMVELMNADKDERVVVLPCKVGDMVWFKTYTDNGKTCVGMRQHKVVSTCAYIVVEGKILPVELPLSGFGKNWFLAREEAEKALEEGRV